jgi:hypothetical protein
VVFGSDIQGKKVGATSAPEGRRSKALEKARLYISIKHAKLKLYLGCNLHNVYCRNKKKPETFVSGFFNGLGLTGG